MLKHAYPADPAPPSAAGVRQTPTDDMLASLLALPWLHGVPHDELLHLARRSHWRHVRKGECITTQGETAECLSLLVQGRAHAERQGPGAARAACCCSCCSTVT